MFRCIFESDEEVLIASNNQPHTNTLRFFLLNQNYTKPQIPLKIDDKEVWISPYREGLGGTLVLLAHGAVPRVVLVQLLAVQRKLIKAFFF